LRKNLLNYQFQSQEATFTDADIEAKMQQIINAYSKQLNAIIRS
jgi:phenylalanyl-tRNA synthetase beta subunit